jgi:amidase
VLHGDLERHRAARGVVPAGFDADGMPVAVQLVARPDDEATLFALAAQIEQARPWAHRRPRVG